MKKIITIVIPFYNGLDTIEELVCGILSLQSSNNLDLTVIIVDDSGNFDKYAQLKSLFESNSSVNILRPSQNLGQHVATFLGLLASEDSDIITIDEDLKFSPLDIPLIIGAENGDAVVYGFTRRSGLGGWFKGKVLSSVKPFISRTYPIHTSSFRFIPKAVVSKLRKLKPVYIQLEGMIIKNALKFETVTVRQQTLNQRQGGYNLFSLYLMVSGLFTHYTPIPWLTSSLLLILSFFATSIIPFWWLTPLLLIATVNLWGELQIRILKRKWLSELKLLFANE